MVEMYANSFPPRDKGEESVDRDQDRLLEELYREMYSVLLCYANAALKDKALAEAFGKPQSKRLADAHIEKCDSEYP